MRRPAEEVKGEGRNNSRRGRARRRGLSATARHAGFRANRIRPRGRACYKEFSPLNIMETILRITPQITLLSGILAGFAMAAVIQLLGLSKGRLIIEISIGVFIVAALCLCLATVGSGILLVAVHALQTTTPLGSSEGFYIKIFNSDLGFVTRTFLGGTVIFIWGIGFIGWIRSRWLGIISTIGAAVVFIIVVDKYIQASSYFPF